MGAKVHSLSFDTSLFILFFSISSSFSRFQVYLSARYCSKVLCLPVFLMLGLKLILWIIWAYVLCLAILFCSIFFSLSFCKSTHLSYKGTIFSLLPLSISGAALRVLLSLSSFSFIFLSTQCWWELYFYCDLVKKSLKDGGIYLSSKFWYILWNWENLCLFFLFYSSFCCMYLSSAALVSLGL